MKLNKVFIFLLIISSYNSTYTQESKELRSYGLNSSFLVSNNNANFKSFGEIESCCDRNYSNISSNNFGLGIYYKDDLYKKIKYYVELGYVNFNEKYVNKDFILTKDGNAEINFVEDINSNVFQNLIGIGYDYKNFNFAIAFLTEINFNSNFDIYETLVYPINSTFENGSRFRNRIENLEPTYLRNWNFGISLLSKYHVFLNNRKTKSISPFIRFDFMLTNYHTMGELYKYNFLIGLSYNLFDYKKLDTPIEPR